MATRKKVVKKKKAAAASSPDLAVKLPPAGKLSSTEIGLHELGEALSISAISVRRELQRYPDEMGLFSIADFELEIPVKLRIDDLGQVMATVVNEVNANDAVARLKIKINPIDELPDTLPVVADQPLDSLGVFNEDQLRQFKEHRIFSVEDLMRAGRGTGTLVALSTIAPKNQLDKAINMAGVLTMPNIPSSVSAALVELKIASPKDFISRNAKNLATQLSKKTGEKISEQDVVAWQASMKELLSIKKAMTPSVTEMDFLKNLEVPIRG